VDIHWDTAPADYPFRFDPEILWRSRCERVVDGRPVSSLEPESLLLFLCVHGTKHMWSRLMWLGDVARLTREIRDWDRALELAREAGCLRPVLTGLLLAHELLDAPLGDDVLRTARAVPVVGELVRQAARRLERIPPSEPGSMELTRFNAKMAEGVWHKARHFGARLWAPTEAEVERVRLPRALFALYYPFRIARLAARYALKPLGYGSTGSRYRSSTGNDSGCGLGNTKIPTTAATASDAAAIKNAAGYPKRSAIAPAANELTPTKRS
jgi:hypothetical protein